MARVFISYARTDAARAEAIAKAVERAGHQVWWDRHIQSGSRFGKQIDQELKAADAILVLWSCSSVESAWVHDEAAEGRDSNRLIPVVIDGCKPPLGFRQYQVFDISGWSGRRKLPVALLTAISTTAAGASKDTNGAPGLEAGEPKLRGRGRIWAAAISLAVAAALLFGGWRYFNGDFAVSSETPTLAVLPFADLSPGGDKAYFAEGVAESILSLLGREPGIRVIGRTSASLVKDRSTDLEALSKSLGVTHVLEGSARTSGEDLRISVRLIDASNGAQVWAEDYQRRLNNVFAIQDEIGKAVATKLVGSLSPGQLRTNQVTRADAYNLYLAARAQMRDRKESVLLKALGTAGRAIELDPQYAPAHALYAELIYLLRDERTAYGSIPQARARAIAIPRARKAIQLAPQAPEGYAALGFVLPPEQAIEPLKRAIRLDPSRAELRVWLALTYEKLARNEDALRETESAVAIDPLWTVPINRLIYLLAASGRFDEANAVVQTYLDRGGEPAQAARFRSVIAQSSGHLAEALKQANLARRRDPNVPYVDEYIEGLAAVMGLPQLVPPHPSRNRMYLWLRAKGNKPALLAKAKSDGAELWNKPFAGIALLALAEVQDWQRLVMLFDARRLTASATCKERTGIIPTVLALRHKGRGAEAAELLNCYEQWVVIQERSPVRSPYLDRNDTSFVRAQILALRNRPDAALAALDEAVQFGWRGYPFSANLASYPALNALRSTPGYSQIQQRLHRLVAAERTKTLRELATAPSKS